MRNKNTKRLISLLTALVLVAVLLPKGTLPQVSATARNGIFYEVVNGEAHVTGWDIEIGTEVVIPDTIDGYPVTYIERDAFSASPVTGIRLGANVTGFDENAFSATENLTAIIVDANNAVFSSDSQGGLYNKAKTRLLRIPGGYTGSFVLPDTVTTIAAAARPETFVSKLTYNKYNGCDYLGTAVNPYYALVQPSDTSVTAVTLHKDTKCVREQAFSSCSKLTTISVESGNTAFRAYNGALYNGTRTELLCLPRAFSGSYTIPSGVTTLAPFSVSSCSKLTALTLANTVTAIPQNAIRYCNNLTSITIPNNVKTLEREAFYSCENLTAVLIGTGLQNLAPQAFAFCSQLQNLVVSASNPYLCSDSQGVVYNKTKTCLICAPTAFSGSYTVPDTVTRIEADAFYWCSGLTEVAIPASVTAIGSYAFAGTGLTEVTVPGGVKTIEEGAFYGCRSLADVTVAPGVTAIGDRAFYNCSAMKEISIPSTVTTVGTAAFFSCEKLEKVSLPGIQTLGETAFRYCSALTDIALPDSLTVLQERTFSDCSSLTAVTLGANLQTIGESAFYYCKALKTLHIPAKVTSIDGSAFDSCDALTGFTVAAENTAYTSKNGILYSKDATVLVRVPGAYTGPVTVDDTVKEFADFALSTCAGVSEVVLPAKLQKLGVYVFRECNGLQTIALPAGITEVPDGAFYMCAGLQSITFPQPLKTIGAGAFSNCRSLKKLVLPDNVTTLKTDAFAACEALTEVTIGSGITQLPAYVFESCESLTAITIPDTVKSIGYRAFYRGGLEQITIGTGVTDIGIGAFYYCEDLAYVFYQGTQAQWEQIRIQHSNDQLTDANRFYQHVHAYPTEPNTVVEPDCWSAGYKEYVCSCGLLRYQEELPKLGHNYDGLTCTRCGESCATMHLHTVALRPSVAGIYFKADLWISNPDAAVRTGIAVSLSNPEPVADGSDSSSLYTEEDGNSITLGRGYSVLITNIMDPENTAKQNIENAKMPIYARAYVEKADGTIIYSETVTASLMQVVLATESVGYLSPAKQQVLAAMYDTFTTEMQLWDIPKIKSYAEKY